MTYRHELSAEQLDDIFRSDIEPLTLAELRPSDEPTLVLLGGQPASGKTMAVRSLLRDARFTGQDFFVPEGDALRIWHPDYQTAVRDDPLQMPVVTKQASGHWLKRSVELSLSRRASLLVEGTWRDASVPQATMEQARKKGYRTHAVLVAVPPEVSRLDMLARYYEPLSAGEPARWTPPAVHDQAVAALEATATALAAMRDVDEFSVITREGRFVADALTPSAQREALVLHSLTEARDSFWTPEARADWLNRVDHYAEAHHTHTRADPAANQVWDQILKRDVPRHAPAPAQAPRAPGRARFEAALQALQARNRHTGTPGPDRARSFDRESPPTECGPSLH